MQKLVDQLEERRLEIEGLKDQISVMQLSPVKASLSETELEEKARQERERKKQMSDRPMQFPEKAIMLTMVLRLLWKRPIFVIRLKNV